MEMTLGHFQWLIALSVLAAITDANLFRSHRIRRNAPPDYTIPPSYNLNALPPHEIPSKVSFSALIMSIEDIKETEEEIGIEMNIRVQWKDTRLDTLVAPMVNSSQFHRKSRKPEYLLLPPSLIQRIWVPDVYIDHLKRIDDPAVLQKPESLRMYSDYSLRYSARITIVVSCPMDFHHYPADRQVCAVDLSSYGYTEDDLVLLWREKWGANFAYPIDLQNFYISLDNPKTFKTQTLSGRKYSGLRFIVILTRKLSYHLIQTFLPSVILVVVSFLSFLISLDAVPARTGLLMTCLLTLISMFASVRQSTPNVSYVKAMDIWMVVCVSFVFLALLEFTVALKLKVLKQKRRRKTKKRKGQGQDVSSPPPPQPPELTANGIQLTNRTTHAVPEIAISQPQRGRKVSEVTISQLHLPHPALFHENFIEQLEFVSSLGIPAMFVLFNFIYWPWLLLISGYSTHVGLIPPHNGTVA